MSLLPGKFYLDDFFDDFAPMTRAKMDMLRCDIYEKGGNVHIELDTPGFKKENIKIDVDNGYLNIEGEISNSTDDSDDRNYIRRERVYSTFKRQFYVGNIDESSITAKFNDGVLSITYPKDEIKETKKFIEIK